MGPVQHRRVKMEAGIYRITRTLCRLSYGSLIFLCSLAPVAASDGAWELDEALSELSYLSIKLSGQRSIVEANRFTKMSGGINGGEAWVDVELSSVDTRVPIRDQRVLEHVFNAMKFPRARVKVRGAGVPPEGTAQEMALEAGVEMRGMREPVPVSVVVTRLSDRLVVETTEPVLIDAGRWEMQQGFEVLRELMKLAHISTTIPVSFRLVFRKK